MLDIKYFKDLASFMNKPKHSQHTYLLYMASNLKFDLRTLNELEINFIGAVFPQLIYNNKLYEDGLIVVEVYDSSEVILIKDIQQASFKVDEFNTCKSIITIVEGTSPYNEAFLEKLFSSVDMNTNILGGGAGSIDNKNRGVIFDKEGFYVNSAILLKIENEIKMGVQHGCSHLEGPFVATTSHQNRLEKIDYKDAFEVYKEAVEANSDVTINKENFAQISQNYPIGVVKYNCEQIVRDPIALVDDALVLVGEIKDNAILNILKVDKASMLEASKKAASEAVSDNSNVVVMFDCTSRVNFLNEAFEQELDNVCLQTKRKTAFGAVTIGEIANSGNRYINFYNKTCVIGAICI